MLKGIDITLYEKTQSGTDEADAPVYTETPVTVHNVLVGEPSAEEITTELQLTGRRLAYTLAIPKGDAHDWNDVQVAFFRPALPHLRGRRAGHRAHDPAVLEQEGAGGKG